MTDLRDVNARRGLSEEEDACRERLHEREKERKRSEKRRAEGTSGSAQFPRGRDKRDGEEKREGGVSH